MQQAKTIQTETYTTDSGTVGKRAAMVRNNPQYDILAHIKDMYNINALNMALKATGKEM